MVKNKRKMNVENFGTNVKKIVEFKDKGSRKRDF